MSARHLFGPALILGVAWAVGQYPPIATNPNGTPRVEVAHKSPIDESEQVQAHPKRRQIDPAQVKREADELAKLSSEMPPAVEQAGKGVISKDLNDRLKRIEKLSKQLRRELFP